MEMKILLLVSILVPTFLVASTEASKSKGHCKCQFSWTENRVNYYKNHCKHGYKPSHHLRELASIDFGVFGFQCKCGCISQEFAKRNIRITKSGYGGITKLRLRRGYDSSIYTRI